MNFGMLWFSNDKKTTFTEKILTAVEYFRKKYKITKDLQCWVRTIPDNFEPIPNITVVLSKVILPDHFWIGLPDGEFKGNLNEQ
jgi:hypothetical protein